jgi:hypothetical protein
MDIAPFGKQMAETRVACFCESISILQPSFHVAPHRPRKAAARHDFGNLSACRFVSPEKPPRRSVMLGTKSFPQCSQSSGGELG